MNNIQAKRLGRLTTVAVLLLTPTMAVPAAASSAPTTAPSVPAGAAAPAAVAAPPTGLVLPPAAVAPHTAVVPQGRPIAIRDSYIVVFRDRQLRLSGLRAIVREIIRRNGGFARRLFSAALRGFQFIGSGALASRIAADPRVQFVEQDRLTWATQTTDQFDPPSWGLDRIDQRNLPLNNQYRYPDAWWTVNAYVIDSGILTTHQQFQGRAVAAFDFTDDGRNIDCNGHGTHVAGTIGGVTVGVAKTTRLYGLRVFDCSGTGSMSDIVAAVDWVTARGQLPGVVNMSLGSYGNSPAMNEALAASTGAGFTYVVAAGNDAGDACGVTPANSPLAITVGAIDERDSRATSYSNYGRCVDVFAPGSNIYSAWSTSNSSYAYMSGTSMASPTVAGAAALVLSRNPTYTSDQVISCLSNDSTVGALSNIGPGSPNALIYVSPDPTGCAGGGGGAGGGRPGGGGGWVGGGGPGGGGGGGGYGRRPFGPQPVSLRR
jgi:subtilisin family serine protease